MAHEREDLTRIKVQPLAVRRSKQAFEAIRVDPRSPPPPAGDLAPKIETVAERIRGARASGASVVLAFGAHLVKNGLGRVVEELMEAGWITHLATNGAGVIHDWEYAFLGRSEEDVRSHVAEGRFGCWDETGRCTLLAVLTGALAGMGYGESIGRFVLDGGCEIPRREDLWHAVADACETGNPALLPGADRTAAFPRTLRVAGGISPRRAPQPGKFTGRGSLSSRRAADGPSRDRLRHRLHSPDGKRCGDGTRGRHRLRGFRPRRGAAAQAKACCCRSVRR